MAETQAQTAPVAASASDPAPSRIGPTHVFISSVGTCPEAKRVENELGPLLNRFDISDSEKDAVQVSIVDEGATFSLHLLEERKEVGDPARDCAERARVAAVLLAMRLEPPIIDAEPHPSEKPEIDEASSKTSQNPSASQLRMDLAVGALVEGGLNPGIGPGWGPLFQLSLRKSAWSFVLQAAALSSETLEIESGSASLTRFPLSIGLGANIGSAGWLIEPSAQIAADIFQMRASELSDSAPETRVDLGARFGMFVSYRKWRVHPFALLRGGWFPRTYSLNVDPLGEVGQTPTWWCGLAFGVGLPLMGE